MEDTTIGKLHGMHQIADDEGIISILALDHRESFKRLVQQSGLEGTYPEVVEEKLRIIRTLSPLSSAVLLDPVFGVASAVAANAISRAAGLVVALDHSGFGGSPFARQTRIIPGWNATRVKHAGASAAKLMLYFNPDSSVAAAQEELARAVAEECRQLDLTFVLEPVTHPVDDSLEPGSPDYALARSDAIIETARRLDGVGADLLKVEFPGDIALMGESRCEQACDDLHGSTTLPWIVLSGGTDFATCQAQVELACSHGASGYAIGRTIWQDAVILPKAAGRDEFLHTKSALRVEILSATARRLATPWHLRGALGRVSELDDSVLNPAGPVPLSAPRA